MAYKRARRYRKGPNAGKTMGRVRAATRRREKRAMAAARLFATSVNGTVKLEKGGIFVEYTQKPPKGGLVRIKRTWFLY